MYILYLVTNLALWLQQINKLYLLEIEAYQKLTVAHDAVRNS